ncbi:AAA family ATPase [Saccharolobus caldissimus]|uniref:Uncharacterized protein n=1 Tax=Saccharolobus caldissimus TaxID=1702097 RepID=A0AAQ4CSB6_9CREN|nr:AAA family ATPase [Saccharolobus caldissimus]BDB98697.1 hypothetical protein SACC_17140 [Saccharolobus caldissimus]
MTVKIEKIIVKDFLGIESAEIELSKPVILYGPNGGGKSSIINAVLKFLKDELIISDNEKRGDNAKLELYYNNNVIEIPSTRYLKGILKDIKYCHITAFNVECNTRFLNNWHFNTDTIITDARLGEIFRKVLRDYVSDPEQNIEFEDFYYDSVRINKKWIPFKNLSYGQKRFLALNLVIELLKSDLIDIGLIEDFDASLHVDFIVNFIENLPTDKSILIETHSAIGLVRAFKQGFNVYYVAGGKVNKISDLRRDAPLLSRELEVVTRV